MYLLKSCIFPKALGYYLKKKISALHLMVLVLLTLRSPNSRHLDDANDKFKIFCVKASVSSGMIFLTLSRETEKLLEPILTV